MDGDEHEMRTDKNKFISAKSSFVDKYIAESKSEFDGEFWNYPQFENGPCFRTTKELKKNIFVIIFSVCWYLFPVVEREGVNKKQPMKKKTNPWLQEWLTMNTLSWFKTENS